LKIIFRNQVILRFAKIISFVAAGNLLIDVTLFASAIRAYYRSINAKNMRKEVARILRLADWFEHYKDKTTGRRVFSESNRIEHEHELRTAISLANGGEFDWGGGVGAGPGQEGVWTDGGAGSRFACRVVVLLPVMGSISDGRGDAWALAFLFVAWGYLMWLGRIL
jgi:hypothetical protein